MLADIAARIIGKNERFVGVINLLGVFHNQVRVGELLALA